MDKGRLLVLLGFLGSVSLAERSETVACGLGNLGVVPVTPKLEMPSSSQMLCLLASEGSQWRGEWGSPCCGYAATSLDTIAVRLYASVWISGGFDTQSPSRELLLEHGPLEGNENPQ